MEASRTNKITIKKILTFSITLYVHGMFDY